MQETVKDWFIVADGFGWSAINVKTKETKRNIDPNNCQVCSLTNFQRAKTALGINDECLGRGSWNWGKRWLESLGSF